MDGKGWIVTADPWLLNKQKNEVSKDQIETKN